MEKEANNTTQSVLPWDEFTFTVEKVFGKSTLWVSYTSYIGLVCLYSLLITAGVIGNLSVLYLACRSPSLRTARNVFIASLAASDFCLCLFTMPLTLMEVVYQNWQWGYTPFFCQLQSPIQAVFIVISAMSITAIAMDRCLAICFQGLNSFSMRTCLTLVPVIWLMAILIVSPLALVKQLYKTSESLGLSEFHFSAMVQLYGTKKNTNTTLLSQMEIFTQQIYRSNATNAYMYKNDSGSVSNPISADETIVADSMVVHYIDLILGEMNFPKGDIAGRCLEKPDEEKYSFNTAHMVFIYILMYLVPLFTVLFANTAIYIKLKNRIVLCQNRLNNRDADIRKMKRTCVLLILMVVIFSLCWLPLTIFNLSEDLVGRLFTDDNTYFTVFALCHLFGMLSACMNPVLYGVLNENFKAEFKSLFRETKSRLLSQLDKETQI